MDDFKKEEIVGSSIALILSYLTLLAPQRERVGRLGKGGGWLRETTWFKFYDKQNAPPPSPEPAAMVTRAESNWVIAHTSSVALSVLWKLTWCFYPSFYSSILCRNNVSLTIGLRFLNRLLSFPSNGHHIFSKLDYENIEV